MTRRFLLGCRCLPVVAACLLPASGVSYAQLTKTLTGDDGKLSGYAD